MSPAHKILEELLRQMPFLHTATLKAKTPPIEERMPELSCIADRLQGMHGTSANWIPDVVKAYVMLSLEFLKLQKELEDTGRYKYATEEEVAVNVYNNKDCFGGYYLPGLLLSEALWPNHFMLNLKFKKEFLSQVSDGSSVLEVGVGAGYHLYHLMKYVQDVKYIGLDISEFAINYSKSFAFGEGEWDGKAKFKLGSISDGIPMDVKGMDAIIFGEVLEHVENPGDVLETLRSAIREEGIMFMTTVIFAANIDHIYMFENADDIRNLVRRKGWKIEREYVLPVYVNDSPNMTKRPMNYGAILRKA